LTVCLAGGVGRHGRRKLPILDAALGLALLAGVSGYSARYCDNSVFTTDAVDYLRGVESGFWANYFETQSGGLWGLISVFLNHPEARSGLWDYLDRANDAAAVLHFHVPLGFYPNMAVRLVGGGDREQRLAMAWEGGLVALIVFGGLRLAGVASGLALSTAAFVCISPAMVSTATDVSPHIAFLAVVLVAGFALARFLETGKGNAMLVAAGAFAAAAAALELSIIAAVAFCVAIGPWLLRVGGHRAVPVLKRAALLFLAASFVFWPGGWIRGGYGLSYGVFIFQALFRRQSYFGSDGFIATWMRAGQGSAWMLILIAMAAAAAMVLVLLKRSNPYLRVFGLLAAGFAAQGMLNHFRNASYVSHFIVTTGVLAALCVQRWLDVTAGLRADSSVARYAVWGAAAAAIALAALGARGWPALSLHRQQEQRATSTRAEQVIAYLKRNLPEDTIVTSKEYRGVWRLYAPGLRIEKSAGIGNLEPPPWLKLRQYAVIADPEGLNELWREKLRQKERQTVGGFEIATFDAQR
jgi:hypothetical protein